MKAMRRHWKNLIYLIRHKYFVFVAGRIIGASWWLLLIHDWSKFLPSEWLPYTNHFYGSPHATAEDFEKEREYKVAWLKHQHRNPHHWQFWIMHEDEGKTYPLVMPDRYVREMVADWAGAGRAIVGRWRLESWYIENSYKMSLHPVTRDAVEQYINRFQDALLKRAQQKQTVP